MSDFPHRATNLVCRSNSAPHPGALGPSQNHQVGIGIYSDQDPSPHPWEFLLYSRSVGSGQMDRRNATERRAIQLVGTLQE